MFFTKGLSLTSLLALVGTLIIGGGCGREDETKIEDVANRYDKAAERAQERVQVDIKLKDDRTALSKVSEKASIPTSWNSAGGQMNWAQRTSGAQGQFPPGAQFGQGQNPLAGHGQYGSNPFDRQRGLFGNQPGNSFGNLGNRQNPFAGQQNPWLSHSAAAAKPAASEADQPAFSSAPLSGDYGATSGYPWANNGYSVPGAPGLGADLGAGIAPGFGAGIAPGFDPAFFPGFGPGASWLPGIFEAPLVINDEWDDDHHGRRRHHHDDNDDSDNDDRNNDDH